MNGSVLDCKGFNEGGTGGRSAAKHAQKYAPVAKFTESIPDERSIQAATREGREKGTQMVDFEKDTRRWWFSPRSWLWNLMRQSMASSTEPIWIRAILWSFLEETERCISLSFSPFPTTIKESTVDSDLLKELEVLDGGS